MPTVEEKIIKKIQTKGRGWCYTPAHFSALGSNESIRKALSQLAQSGKIKRLCSGIYEYPRQHEVLGELPPDINNVIKAVTERDKVSFLPSGAYAANLLGLSEQVPAKIVVLTAGTTKTIRINKTEIRFKKTTPKNMLLAQTVAGLIVQAFKFIGKENITPGMISVLQKNLSKEDRKQLRKCLDLTPVWISKIIKNKFLGE